jgi:hypothetical protein
LSPCLKLFLLLHRFGSISELGYSKMSRRTLVEPEVVLVSLREIMEEALKNPKVTKSKEDAHRTRGAVMVEVLTGWTAAAALALRYEGDDWFENEYLQKLLPIMFERLVDSEGDTVS